MKTINNINRTWQFVLKTNEEWNQQMNERCTIRLRYSSPICYGWAHLELIAHHCSPGKLNKTDKNRVRWNKNAVRRNRMEHDNLSLAINRRRWMKNGWVCFVCFQIFLYLELIAFVEEDEVCCYKDPFLNLLLHWLGPSVRTRVFLHLSYMCTYSLLMNVNDNPFFFFL